MSYSKLRSMARESLKENWLMAIGLFAVSFFSYGLFDLVLTPDDSGLFWDDIVLFAISILLIPMTVGLHWAWIDLSRNKKIGFGHLFQPYKTLFATSILTGLLQGIFIILWSLLFIVPGIIKSFSYMLAYYILRDHPELSPLQAITKSRHMMNGFKGKAFWLGLSFIGWVLLGIVTFGLAFFWVVPYISVTFAHFYNSIRDQEEKQAE